MAIGSIFLPDFPGVSTLKDKKCDGRANNRDPSSQRLVGELSIMTEAKELTPHQAQRAM